MGSKRKYTDWDSIEPLYRAGAMSLNDICCQYEADHQHSQVWKTTVTHPAILKKAKEKKWTKNLAERVQDRVREKLVTSLVTDGNQTDEEMVEASAAEPLRVARSQRERTRNLLVIQDELAAELRLSVDLDVMTRVKGFKDIAASVRALQDQQADQYRLNDQPTDDKARIRVGRYSPDE
jgi:hypothetical protein